MPVESVWDRSPFFHTVPLSLFELSMKHASVVSVVSVGEALFELEKCRDR